MTIAAGVVPPRWNRLWSAMCWMHCFRVVCVGELDTQTWRNLFVSLDSDVLLSSVRWLC